MFLLSSCHSEYLNLKITADGTISWNKDHSGFAFIARTRLYRMPVGIARFPDGGRSKDEYLDFSLYHFNIENNKLTHIINLNEYYLGSAYRWLSISQIALSLHDNNLFYKLIDPYDYNIKYIHEDEKTEFLDNIAKTYKINILTLKKDVVDTAVYKDLFNNERERLSVSCFKEYFSDCKFSEWGIILKDIYPQSKKTYIDYIVLGSYNKNILDAIYEQIVPEFNQKDIKHILEKMEKRKQELFKNFNKLNEEKDPYRKSLRQDKYEDYLKYIEETEKKLNISNDLS